MTFQEFKDKLFAHAKAQGLTEFELYYSSGDAFRVTAYEGQIDQYSVNTHLGVSFRALIDDKMGYAYTEALDEAAVEMLVTMVKQNAEVIEVTDVPVIYEGDAQYPQVNSFHDALSKVPPQDKISLVLDMEKKALALDERIASVQMCTVGSGEHEVGIVNSKGLDVFHRANLCYGYLEPVANDGDRQRSGFYAKAGFDFQDLNAADIAREGVHDALSYIGAKSIPTGNYAVVIKKQAMSALLDTFAGIFSAEAAQKGLSLLRDKIGRQIGSSVVTIMDDPLMRDGFASSPFDAEGVACYTKPIVDQGTLTTLLHNLKTAKKDGRKSTGNAAKGTYASPVDIAPSNFYIKPGSRSFDEMIAAVGDGILITDLSGLHAGAHMVSGDFSLEAKGFHIEGGKLGAPIELITLSGNFYTLLQDIVETADDLYFDMPSGASCFGAPSVWVKSLAIAGL